MVGSERYYCGVGHGCCNITENMKKEYVVYVVKEDALLFRGNK